MISFATARRQARERRHPLSVELSRLLAHGLLHLLGYDHERPADARRMAAAEDTLLGRAGMVRESRAGR
jgi:probable rRNA maturation factor